MRESPNNNIILNVFNILTSFYAEKEISKTKGNKTRNFIILGIYQNLRKLIK